LLQKKETVKKRLLLDRKDASDDKEENLLKIFL